jgi:hypothetical protein
MKTVQLSEEAFALVAAMVSRSELVDHAAVTASEKAWDEVRAAFPIRAFRNAVAQGTLTYEPQL